MSEHPSPASPEKHINKPHLKYILCEHIWDNADRIIDEAGDCDIIVLEAVGGTPVQRLKQQARINRLAALPADSPESEELWIRQSNSNTSQFINSIALRLMGTQKEFHFSDVDNEHADKYLDDKSEEDYAALTGSFDDPNTPPDYDALNKFLDTSAASTAARNNVQQAQIKRIEEANPDKRIAIVSGSAHSSISYQDSAGNKAERVFIHKGGPDTPIIFTPIQQAIRQRVILPEKPLDEKLQKLCMLESAIFELGKVSPEVADFDALSNEMLEAARQEEIPEIDAAITGMLQAVREKRRQHASREDYVQTA